MLYFLYTIHILVCIFLILVVLLQRGKGADLSVFGGGSTQAAFGARGAATLLHKLTVGFFVAFMITTISIALYQGRSHSGSVLSDVSDEAPATEAGEAEAGAGEAGEPLDAAGTDAEAGDAGAGEAEAGAGTESAPEGSSMGPPPSDDGAGEGEPAPSEGQ